MRMRYEGVDTIRIQAEYQRRARDVPRDYYSLGKPANLLMHQQTVRSCIAALRRALLFPLHGRRIADIGCGSGGWLLEFMKWGADPLDLAGVDLMPDRIEAAHLKIPQADLHLGSASELPWPDGSFDIVSQFLVFTNMFDPTLKRAVAAEMLRVLKPGGGILWFDLRVDNPKNPEVRGVRRKEITELFPGCDVDLIPALLAPPVSRIVAPRSIALGEMLHILPFLRTHYAGCIRKVPSKTKMPDSSR